MSSVLASIKQTPSKNFVTIAATAVYTMAAEDTAPVATSASTVGTVGQIFRDMGKQVIASDGLVYRKIQLLFVDANTYLTYGVGGASSAVSGTAGEYRTYWIRVGQSTTATDIDTDVLKVARI